ncbi:hypothetical protein ACFOWM_06170 [Ferruginibacter yonginensis]|uniref:Uncharacterized protein n=1 Tax=Ferruginibacter yonginensis TaxID=1310416 RepID=A0ABV8QQ98_9BACT
MIKISDNIGETIFEGSVEDAIKFFEAKSAIKEKAKDKNLREWATAAFMAPFIIAFMTIVFKMIEYILTLI